MLQRLICHIFKCFITSRSLRVGFVMHDTLVIGLCSFSRVFWFTFFRNYCHRRFYYFVCTFVSLAVTVPGSVADFTRFLCSPNTTNQFQNIRLTQSIIIQNCSHFKVTPMLGVTCFERYYLVFPFRLQEGMDGLLYRITL